MAGCELNIAPAFVAAPTTHHRHIHHDAIVTSADDFRHCAVTDDDDAAGSRASMIPPHYRLVPCSLAQGTTAGSEWVTLSKSVLLQLVERICQLSFQADSLPPVSASTATTDRAVNPPSDSRETSSQETLMDAAESPDGTENHSPSLTQAGRPLDTSPVPSEGVRAETVESADTIDQGDVHEVPASVIAVVASGDQDMLTSINVNSDARTQETDCGQADNDVTAEFAANEPMLEAAAGEDENTEDSSSLCSKMSSDVTLPDHSVVYEVPPTAAAKPVGSVPVRSTQSLRTDRRRRLRELRRLRRHHQKSVVTTAADDLQQDGGRRRADVVVRRRFAVPRQPPPPCPRDRRPSDVDERFYGACPDVHASMTRLSVAPRRHGHVFQPWSALNKVVVCQLVDVVLSQELTPIAAAWRPATTTSTSEKRRSSGTIWNPAISPDTRESDSRIPQLQRSSTVEDVPSVNSSLSAEAAPSSLLHTLLGPIAAATSYLDRRRSETSAVDADVDGSLAWTMPPARRRRHHSAAGPDTFHAPWTPSFFWYNVPPTQGNVFALPDAAAVAASPCFRWITLNHQSPTLPSAPAALDYRVQTLDAAVACPEGVGVADNEAPDVVCGSSLQARRRRVSRPSTPPASPLARPKWVVVNKTDVCSLFESLASSMVDDDVAHPSLDASSSAAAVNDSASASAAAAEMDVGAAAVAASVEPVKWKSTLLRRARAEQQTPRRSSDSSADVALIANN